MTRAEAMQAKIDNLIEEAGERGAQLIVWINPGGTAMNIVGYATRTLAPGLYRTRFHNPGGFDKESRQQVPPHDVDTYWHAEDVRAVMQQVESNITIVGADHAPRFSKR